MTETKVPECVQSHLYSWSSAHNENAGNGYRVLLNLGSAGPTPAMLVDASGRFVAQLDEEQIERLRLEGPDAIPDLIREHEARMQACRDRVAAADARPVPFDPADP